MQSSVYFRLKFYEFLSKLTSIDFYGVVHINLVIDFYKTYFTTENALFKL